MDATFHALGEILLKAVPTFLLVFFLNYYLRAVFYKPLERVRQQRYEATDGARQRAQESIERAEKKTAEYERALREAQAAVYQTQDKLHRELQDRQAADLHAARQQADVAVQQAKAALGGDIAAAKTSLARDSELLANQIVESILRRSAA
jgi:F-type H+-transporting ATPase subunit b